MIETTKRNILRKILLKRKHVVFKFCLPLWAECYMGYRKSYKACLFVQGFLHHFHMILGLNLTLFLDTFNVGSKGQREIAECNNQGRYADNGIFNIHGYEGRGKKLLSNSCQIVAHASLWVQFDKVFST